MSFTEMSSTDSVLLMCGGCIESPILLDLWSGLPFIVSCAVAELLFGGWILKIVILCFQHLVCLILKLDVAQGRCTDQSLFLGCLPPPPPPPPSFRFLYVASVWALYFLFPFAFYSSCEVKKHQDLVPKDVAIAHLRRSHQQLRPRSQVKTHTDNTLVCVWAKRSLHPNPACLCHTCLLRRKSRDALQTAQPAQWFAHQFELWGASD